MSELTLLKERTREVVDEAGRGWALGSEIARGGQGVVYRVEGHGLAVKLTLRPRPDTYDRFAAIRRLPLEGVPIAAPRTLLREPDVGYVMELVDGVVTLDSLIERGRTGHGYRETGGLKRRIDLLERLSRALATLHSRAIVYGDLNPFNVLVSEDPSRSELRLIDPDNLRSAAEPGIRIGFPRYRAPEIVTGAAPADIRTDAFSLAILIYETLTGAHPLTAGALVQDDVRLEADESWSEIPWVAHPDDDRNRQMGYLPHEHALTRALFGLARRAFEEGREVPRSRPAADEWQHALDRAHGLCVACQECANHFFVHRSTPCPFCGAPRPRMLGLAFGIATDGDERAVFPDARRVVVADGETTCIRRVHTAPTPLDDVYDDVLSVSLCDGRIDLAVLDGQLRLVSRNSEEVLSAGDSRSLPARKEGRQPWRLHFGTPGTNHRFAEAKLLGEATIG